MERRELCEDNSKLEDLLEKKANEMSCEAVLAKLVICQPLPAIIPKHRHLAKYKTTPRSTAV